MTHAPLHDICREIAEKETRFLIFQEDYKDLPRGEYGFVELYCNDMKCDCRNVYIQVINRNYPEPLATISYGWESLKFYKDWMGGKDNNDIIEDFKGPSLALTQQSKYADTLLELFIEILKDDKYVERLKEHYNLFKDEIKKRTVLENQQVNETKVGRNDPCICGSGLKYKKCCG